MLSFFLAWISMMLKYLLLLTFVEWRKQHHFTEKFRLINVLIWYRSFILQYKCKIPFGAVLKITFFLYKLVIRDHLSDKSVEQELFPLVDILFC